MWDDHDTMSEGAARLEEQICYKYFLDSIDIHGHYLEVQ